MEKNKITKIISGIVSLNMFLAYGIFPFNDAGFSLRNTAVVSAAGVEYTVSGNTMTI